MPISTWMTRTLAGFAAVVLTCSGLQAGLLPTQVTITPDSGNYRWTYAIVLPTDMKLQAGNFFTIYDFAGYLPGSETAPAGWTFTASLVGPTPSYLSPDDDAGTWNLTWTYTGPTIASGQIGLGNFWAYSQYGEAREDYFTAHTNRTSDGLVDNNITNTIVPQGQDTPPPPVVPEPATLALAGIGLPLLGLARLARRRPSAH